MVIEKVRVSHTSPREKGGGRILSVKTKKDPKPFETPIRAVSSTEANYKKAVGCDEYYENKIMEIIGIFNEDSLRRLHSKNGPFASRKQVINAVSRQYEDMNTMFHPQPQWGARNLTYNDKDLKFLVELQYRSGLQFIRIPDVSIGSKPDVFKKIVFGYSKLVKDTFHLEPVLLLDLAMDADLFRKKLDMIVNDKTDTFKMVAFQHRSFDLYAANYGTIWDKRDEEIWFHLSGVNRLHPSNYITAQLHYAQRYGIDTCARLTQQVPIEIPPKPIFEVKRYDAKLLGIIPLKVHQSRFGQDLRCDCSICEDKSLDQYIKSYKKNQHGVDSSLTLDTWGKVHEVFASTKEFEKGREAIKNDDLKEYLKGKEYYKHLKK